MWNIRSVRSNNDHPAKFPTELAKRVIRLFSDKDDLVLDPFAGSGTTGIAALAEGRRFIGFDKTPEYVELACRNCGLPKGDQRKELAQSIGLKVKVMSSYSVEWFG